MVCMSSQGVVESITAGVTYVPDFGQCLARYLAFDEELGFMTLPDLTGGNLARQHIMVGYVPVPPGKEAGEQLRSVTQLSEVPQGERSIRRQARGVGLRLANTWQAASNELPAAGQFGMYIAGINRKLLLDCRYATSFNRLQKAGDIALRGVLAIAGGMATLEQVAAQAHASYGNAQSVLCNQPPETGLRLWRRPAASPVPPQYLLLRSADVVLQRVGVLDRTAR